MKIYLYESHLGGLYLSEKDGLNAPCKECGKSDECLNIWWVDSPEDIRRMIYGLMGFLIQRYGDFNEFDELCNQLSNMYQVFKDFADVEDELWKERFKRSVEVTCEAVKVDVCGFARGLMYE